jgi:hypothetical protein
MLFVIESLKLKSHDIIPLTRLLMTFLLNSTYGLPMCYLRSISKSSTRRRVGSRI